MAIEKLKIKYKAQK